MLPALGCLYGSLSMACTTGSFWTKAKLSRPSTTLPNCKRSGPSSISHRSNATECTTSTITPRPHVAKTTKSLLATFSWTVLAHPSYSPDLASYYHLVPDMQRFLEGTD
uniref:Histone-lysine N-methyltransferase SETMAR n=1 Tax=Caenorhabditis japonica TaxID=281687 RepID=A0A8R1E3V5_CAEJA